MIESKAADLREPILMASLCPLLGRMTTDQLIPVTTRDTYPEQPSPGPSVRGQPSCDGGIFRWNIGDTTIAQVASFLAGGN